MKTTIRLVMSVIVAATFCSCASYPSGPVGYAVPGGYPVGGPTAIGFAQADARIASQQRAAAERQFRQNPYDPQSANQLRWATAQQFRSQETLRQASRANAYFRGLRDRTLGPLQFFVPPTTFVR